MLKPRLFLLVSALGFSACVVHSDHPDDYGTLVLEWTINGVDDPSECRGVDSISVHVETADGIFVDDFTEPCESFEALIDLPEDDYHADVVLIDSRGRDATTAVPTDDFPIYPREDTPVHIDFPEDSFF